jgi:hypothetical protein
VTADRPVAARAGIALLLALITTLVLLLVPGLVGQASAADRGTVFKVGGNVTIPQTDSAAAVIVVGGDVTVAGTVRDARQRRQQGQSAADGRRGRERRHPATAHRLSAARSARTGRSSAARPTVSGSWAGDIWHGHRRSS